MVARNYTESNYARLLQQGVDSGDEIVGGDFITLTSVHQHKQVLSPLPPQSYHNNGGGQYYDLNSMTE